MKAVARLAPSGTRRIYRFSPSPLVVYRHRAFISQLAVGDHTSYWEQFHPDYGLFTSTVTLRVLLPLDPRDRPRSDG